MLLALANNPPGVVATDAEKTAVFPDVVVGTVPVLNPVIPDAPKPIGEPTVIENVTGESCSRVTRIRSVGMAFDHAIFAPMVVVVNSHTMLIVNTGAGAVVGSAGGV